MSGRVVALLEELTPEHRAAFEAALPSGWSAAVGAPEIGAASAVVVRDATLDAAALGRGSELGRVIKIDVGKGTVDTDACRARGVRVELVESVALTSVGEHAVMVILALLKQLPEASARLRAGVICGGVQPALTTQDSYAYNWVGLSGFDALTGQTVGLIGLGRIGLHVAKLLRAFDADVVYTKRTRLEPDNEHRLGVRYLPFDELLTVSRCVSVHARVTPETERMFAAREFALMPVGSLFVNTSRGRLVDEAALIDALTSGHLAGAALDVFWFEPLPPDSPLLDAPNLILTPHTGGIPSAESQLLELKEAARRLEE